MFHKRSGLIIAICLTLFIHCQGNKDRVSQDLFPKFPDGGEVPGFFPINDGYLFSDREIFAYINGDGEVVLEYKFQAVKAREYRSRDSNQSINIDVYAMDRPEEAFGLFSLYRSGGEAVNIGNEAVMDPYQIMFWKGKYLVKVSTYDDSSELQASLEKMARRMADNIADNGKRPTMVEALPNDFLDKSSIAYFHGPLAFQNRCSLLKGDVLRLGSETEAVYACYKKDDASLEVIAISYPSEQAAREVWKVAVSVLNPSILDTENWRMQVSQGGVLSGIIIKRKNMIYFFLPLVLKEQFFLNFIDHFIKTFAPATYIN